MSSIRKVELVFFMIDEILYINLDHRTDRKESFLREMARLGVQEKAIHRIPGVDEPHNGIKGCLLSHIHALEHAKKKRAEQVLILEDDVLFHSDHQKVIHQLETFFKLAGNDWDVFLLGGIFDEKESAPWEGFLQIRDSWCSHAYVVNGHYIEKLLCCFQYGYNLIRDHIHTHQSLHASLDQIWKILQRDDRWYAGEFQGVFQRHGKSDIDLYFNPFSRFSQIIYIDEGKGDEVLRELEMLQIDPMRIHRIEGKGDRRESHLQALECAIKIGGRSTLILEDHTHFSRSVRELDEDIAHFFKWKGFEWNVFLLGEGESMGESTDHPDFLEITASEELGAYAVTRDYYETLYKHYKESAQKLWTSLQPDGGWYTSLPTCYKN